MKIHSRSKEDAMCDGEQWELLKQAYAREFARRNREKAEAESRKQESTAPPKPATAPAKNEEPVPA
jgi:hypothetical protein